MVVGLFSSVKSLLTLKKKAKIDNWVFQLNYKLTAALTLVCCVLVTAYQYIGDPIDCFGPSPGLANFNDIVDTYCWIHSTFTLPAAFDKKVGIDVPHPGIDKHTAGEDRVYHKYYQWVCFILAFQTMAFYAPHLFWKAFEGGKIAALSSGMNNPVLDEKTKDDKIEVIVNYFKRHNKRHQAYFAKYVFCELLNFVNIVAQIIATDKFLGGEFSTYGAKVISFVDMDQSDRVDPMVKVFPKITKCTFHFYGSSGDVQKNDLMCILPLNIVNEKIYVMLWFWFMFVAVVNALQTVYRFLTIFSPCFRSVMMRSKLSFTRSVRISGMMEHFRIGDWFLLRQLSNNMEAGFYNELLSELSNDGSTYSDKKTLVSDA